MRGDARLVTWWTATVTALVVATAILSSLDPAVAERYAVLVYPSVTQLLVPIAAAVPGSATLFAGAFAIVALAVAAWRGSRLRASGLVTVLALAAVLWGVAAWGVHYRRAPVAERLGLAATATSSEVERLTSMLLATITDAAPADPLDDAAARAGVEAIAHAMRALAAELEGWDVALPESVVQLPAGSLLVFGTSGIVSPWWLEAHVDGALPPAARIAVAAHELAHLAGWAREDEAEALGALAAWRANDPNARYAGTLFQVARLASTLPEAEREALYAQLPDRAREDLRAAADAARAYGNPALVRLSRRLYDRYLRTQGIDDGIRSYAEATDLLARMVGADLERVGGPPAPRPASAPPDP